MSSFTTKDSKDESLVEKNEEKSNAKVHHGFASIETTSEDKKEKSK